MPLSPVKNTLRVLALVMALLFLVGVAAVAGGAYLFGSKFGSLPQLSKDALEGEPEPEDAGKKPTYFNATKSGAVPTPQPAQGP